MSLKRHYISFSVNYAHFSVEIIVFFLLIYKRWFYIKETDSSSHLFASPLTFIFAHVFVISATWKRDNSNDILLFYGFWLCVRL